GRRSPPPCPRRLGSWSLRNDVAGGASVWPQTTADIAPGSPAVPRNAMPHARAHPCAARLIVDLLRERVVVLRGLRTRGVARAPELGGDGRWHGRRATVGPWLQPIHRSAVPPVRS